MHKLSKPEQDVFYAPRVKNPKFSVLIPMYNEQAILESTLEALNIVLPRMAKQYEIILVDDNSKDNTLAIALEQRKMNPSLGIAAYAEGPTRRENLSRTFALARAPYSFMVDMDLSMKPDFLPIMLRKLVDGYAVVTASRYAPGAHVVRSTFRLVVSKIYNWCIRRYLKTNYYDNVCGFKAFRKEAILTLINELSFDKTLHRGFFWDAELLLRATNHHFPIFELPVIWTAGRKSEIRIKREMRMFRYIMKFKTLLQHEAKSGQIRGLPPNPLRIQR